MTRNLQGGLLKNVQFCSSSRKTKLLIRHRTLADKPQADIEYSEDLYASGVLKSEPDAEIGQKGTCDKGFTGKEDILMYDKKELCEKIIQLYPDIGECGIDVNVDYDKEQQAWVVNLKKDRLELKTFLEDADAALCMDGKQCVSLGLEIAQLKDNIAQL